MDVPKLKVEKRDQYQLARHIVQYRKKSLTKSISTKMHTAVMKSNHWVAFSIGEVRRRLGFCCCGVAEERSGGGGGQ